MYNWTSMPAAAPAAEPAGPSLLVQALVGGLAGFGFYHFAHLKMAIFVWGVTATLSVGSASSVRFRLAVLRFAAALSGAVGFVLRGLLLFPFYLLVMGPYAAIRRLAGADRLALRHREQPSYWVDRRGSRGDYTRPY